MSGGKGSGNTKTVQEPWSGVQPYLTGGSSGGKGGGMAQGIFPEAQRLYGQQLPLTAGFNPLQQSAQQGQLNFAGQLPGMLEPYQQAGQFALSDVLKPDSNPYLQEYMDAATRPLEQNYGFNIAPGIRSQAVGAGQYGNQSSRAGIAEGIARGITNQAITDTRGRIASEAYGQGLNQQARALALYPQILQSGLMPSQLVGDVGGQYQALEQARLNEPYERLNRYASIIQPGSGIGGTITQQGGPTGGLAGALGGGLGGAGAASMLGLTGPAGWGVAGLGALLGLFS